ncbi:MAG: hypothetical protein ABIH23_36305 [bacterium]
MNRTAPDGVICADKANGHKIFHISFRGPPPEFKFKSFEFRKCDVAQIIDLSGDVEYRDLQETLEFHCLQVRRITDTGGKQ